MWGSLGGGLRMLVGCDLTWMVFGCGFTKGLGACSAYVAKLWGVLEGLKMARVCGVRKLEIHIDSMVVVTSINAGKGGTA
ncbi:ribonuclease H protein, partial [Trifolium medium]|nr:ribonuclease H protein [Trifolium medium]